MTRADKARLQRILINPDLGPRFRRLGKRQQAEILINLRGTATKREILTLDAQRRAKEAARSQERRTGARAMRDWGYTKARSPQPLKYRAWLVDDHDNIRGTMDFARAPGDIIDQTEYRDNRYKDGGLRVVAVTVK